MAGNNSIQILRGTSEKFDQASCTEVLMEGQPFFDVKLKHFYIGDGVNSLKDLDTIHPDYAENSLTADEVVQIWMEVTNGKQ